MRKLGSVVLMMLFMAGIMLIPLEQPVEVANVSIIGPTVACAQASPAADEECDPPQIDCPGGGVQPPPPPPPPSACDLAMEMCELCESGSEPSNGWYCAICGLQEFACGEITITDPYGIINPGGTD